MRIREVTIKNFKAIEEAHLTFADFNVIVGSNGSGKSSILQSMHWIFQSSRSRTIETNKDTTKGSTLSERDATYMPSPEYRNSGNGSEYGNRTGSPQLEMAIQAEMDDGSGASATMWIKSARNEGLSVHVPSGNNLAALIRDPKREFSAYIPGLAGIPLSEEKRSKSIVHRLAAAGDANTVLRNFLHLLKSIDINGKTGLKVVEELVSEVMGDFHIDVDFEDDNDSTIQSRFRTAEMAAIDNKRFKPLELAGIGFLQVLQIFAYLVYFRPVVLLVDEPDSHLHPTAQERLVVSLARAAQKFDTQIIMTTHSPSIVRALPATATVIWMKDGKVQPDGGTSGRNLMGWGLLDRRILLITEDEDAGMLQALLSQWPDVDRKVAVWPVHGSSKLPEAEVVSGLHDLFGGSLKVILHRDRDFLMPAEITVLSDPYKKHGHEIWFSMNSDIESYWNESSVVAAHFGVSTSDAAALIAEAVAQASTSDVALKTRRKKRNDAFIKLNKKGDLPQFGDQEIAAEAGRHGQQHLVLGKDLMAAIRSAAHKRGYKDANNFGNFVPPGLAVPMAMDLHALLQPWTR